MAHYPYGKLTRCSRQWSIGGARSATTKYSECIVVRSESTRRVQSIYGAGGLIATASAGSPLGFDENVASFYFDQCGFRPTAAGLRYLQ